MSSNTKTYVTLFLIIVLVFVLNLISFKNGHHWGGDFSLYIDQARTLVNGDFDELRSKHEYRLENSTVKVSNLLYSWGFPILLSPVYYMFGLDINAMKIYVNLFFLLTLLIVFLIFKDDLSNSNNLFLIAIIAFNQWFFDFKDAVLSDIPFFFFSMLSILLIKRFVINKNIWLNSILSYSLIGISIFSTFYIREIGIFLLPTLLISQYIESNYAKKNLKSFLFSDVSKFIPFLTFLVILIAVSLSPLSKSNYDRALYEFSLFNASTIIINIKYYFFLFSRFFPFLQLGVSAYDFNFWDFNYSKASLLFYGTMILIVMHGMMRNIKKDYLFITYGLFSIAFLLIFPHRQGARFIIHLFPFFLYFLFIGLSKINIHFEISDNFSALKLNAATLFGVSLAFVSLLYISHASYQNIIFNKTKVIDGPYSADSVEMFNYIKKNTKRDDAVIFFKPRVMSLYTDRKSFALNSYNFTSDKALNSPARYIAFSKTKYISSDLAIQDFQGKLDCEFENNTFILCDLRKNANR